MLRRGHGDNVASMAWNRHAIAQTQLRKHVASMAWGARYLISTQVWPPPPRERSKDPFGRGKGGDRVEQCINQISLLARPWLNHDRHATDAMPARRRGGAVL